MVDHREEPVRLETTEQLNQLPADTMTLRDLYKKSHWQVAGPTFYQLHLLYDKHYDEQVELVDAIAERIQLLAFMQEYSLPRHLPAKAHGNPTLWSSNLASPDSFRKQSAVQLAALPAGDRYPHRK